MNGLRIKRYQPGHSGLPAQRGFTLLEVMLAFVVFALSFATVLEIIAGSMRSTVRAREYSEAALLAQSLMDMVGSEIPLEENAYGGEAPGGYRWSIDIVDYQLVSDDVYILDLAERNGTRLYWVDLEVEWGRDRRTRNVHFTTVRSALEGRRR